MNKENKINAILNIVANKEPECDVLEFIELDSNNNEIKRETVKRLASNRTGSAMTIEIRTEYYESTKTNLLKLAERLSKE